MHGVVSHLDFDDSNFSLPSFLFISPHYFVETTRNNPSARMSIIYHIYRRWTKDKRRVHNLAKVNHTELADVAPGVRVEEIH